MLNKELLKNLANFDPFVLLEENPALFEENLEVLHKARMNLYNIWRCAAFFKLRAEYGERDSDIHLVTHAKSGTTLTQMILYQMTTDGNMDFKHLYDVSPWLMWDVTHSSKPFEIDSRRILKSHDHYNLMATVKKGKFVFVIRDGLDAVLSFYHHHVDYYNRKFDFEEFSKDALDKWLEYNTMWLENKQNLDILYLNYEDVVNDKENSIRKLAKFLDIPLTDEIMQRTLERTSFDFMKKHQEKFGEQPDHKKVYDNFIRKGVVGTGKQQFSEELLAEYKEKAQGFLAGHEVTKRYFMK